MLKRLFPRGRAREIAKQTGRPLTAVRQKACNMGIKTRERRFCSANEIKLLKKLYPTENTQSIADKLGRSLGWIRTKANLIGLKKVGRTPVCVWSREEVILLRKMYPDNSIRDIANQLSRTVSKVNYKVRKLRLRKANPVWSKKELNQLRKLYPSRTAQQIAGYIGRSVPATKTKIHRLGLKKKKKESHRTIDDKKQKRCLKCKKWKDESEFNKDQSRKDGLNSWCKKCYRNYYLENSKTLKRYLRYEERHRIIDGVKEKRCNGCKKWMDESGFYKACSHKDGLSERCKECANKATDKAHKKRLASRN